MIATVVAAAVAMVPVLGNSLPGMHTTAQYSWFIGMLLGLAVYSVLAPRFGVAESSAAAEADRVPV